MMMQLHLLRLLPPSLLPTDCCCCPLAGEIKAVQRLGTRELAASASPAAGPRTNHTQPQPSLAGVSQSANVMCVALPCSRCNGPKLRLFATAPSKATRAYLPLMRLLGEATHAQHGAFPVNPHLVLSVSRQRTKIRKMYCLASTPSNTFLNPAPFYEFPTLEWGHTTTARPYHLPLSSSSTHIPSHQLWPANTLSAQALGVYENRRWRSTWTGSFHLKLTP